MDEKCMNTSCKAPQKYLWIVFAVLFVFVFSSSCYNLDTVSIVRYELTFADSLIHGQIGNFYQKTYDVMQIYQPSHSPTYDLPMNLVLGIWGIPLYFITKLKGTIDIAESFTCLLYGKSILLISLFASIYLVYMVCCALKLSKERSKWGAFIFLTSLLTLSCTGIVGQSDIIGIVPTLAGIYAYIRGKNKQFLFWFVIAFPFKLYSFFVFLPLLLLKQKNILKIVSQVAMIFGFTFIADLPIRNCVAAYEFKHIFSQMMFEALIENRLPFVNGVSSTVFLWGMVCLYCFLHKNSDDEEMSNSTTVFVMLAAMLSIFVGFGANCYWYVNMAPYMAIAIVYNKKNTKQMLLFETVGVLSLTVVNVIKNHWCFDVQNCENMLLDRIFRNHEFQGSWTLQKMVTETNLPLYQSALGAIYVICMIALLWLIWPPNMDNQTEESMEQSAILRAGINCCVALIPALLYIIGVL